MPYFVTLFISNFSLVRFNCVPYFQRYGLLKTSTHTGQVLQMTAQWLCASTIFELLAHTQLRHQFPWFSAHYVPGLCRLQKSAWLPQKKRKDRFFLTYFHFSPSSLHRQTSYKVSNLCLLNSKSFWMGLKTVLFKNDKTIFVQICQAKQIERSSPSPKPFKTTYAVRPNCLSCRGRGLIYASYIAKAFGWDSKLYSLKMTKPFSFKSVRLNRQNDLVLHPSHLKPYML